MLILTITSTPTARSFSTSVCRIIPAHIDVITGRLSITMIMLTTKSTIEFVSFPQRVFCSISKQDSRDVRIWTETFVNMHLDPSIVAIITRYTMIVRYWRPQMSDHSLTLHIPDDQPYKHDEIYFECYRSIRSDHRSGSFDLQNPHILCDHFVRDS